MFIPILQTTRNNIFQYPEDWQFVIETCFNLMTFASNTATNYNLSTICVHFEVSLRNKTRLNTIVFIYSLKIISRSSDFSKYKSYITWRFKTYSSSFHYKFDFCMVHKIFSLLWWGDINKFVTLSRNNSWRTKASLIPSLIIDAVILWLFPGIP